VQVPFCAFNGGNDVFVDIGNKSLGLHALKKFIGAESSEVRFCKRSVHAPVYMHACTWEFACPDSN
jgi:IMP-specific 5'-nucleotidase